MVVLKIHVVSVAVLESERDAPVAGHGHAVIALAVAGKPMEAQARHIHIVHHWRGIQAIQNTPDTWCVRRIDSALTSIPEESFQSLVFERSDHWVSVMLHITAAQPAKP